MSAGTLEQGRALIAEGHAPEALEAAIAAIGQAPGFAPAHVLRYEALWALGEHDKAMSALEQAIKLSPDIAQFHAAAQTQRLDQADWRGYEASVRTTRKLLWSGELTLDPLKVMCCLGDPADQHRAARVFARGYPARGPLWTGQPRRAGRIRLGYLSSDFYDHAVAHVIAGVLERHDRDRFEVTAFSACPPYPGAIRDRLVAAFDHFENLVEADDETIARLIRERDIDILVALGGYTPRARPGVLAWRPAPVQVNYLGYPGTLAAPYADYLIADHEVVPQGHAAFYDEQVVRLPKAYLPAEARAAGPAPKSGRAAERLPQAGLVLMAYHPPHKISPPVFAAWMRVLARLRGAVLWLQAASPEAAANLRGAAEGAGVDPGRLVFAEKVASRDDHLARQRLADLFIDTLPYGAHSTASDALLAGLPVVTCRGGAFPGRVAASLLCAAGFPELAAGSLAEYEDLIVALGGDGARLAALRERVARQAPASPLFDTAAYTRHLEAAFQTMYERSRSGLPPAGFDVEMS